MSKRITFQFDDKLDYQIQAIDSTVKLFKGISRQVGDSIYPPSPSGIKRIDETDPVRNPEIVGNTRLLKNLRQVQLRNRLFASESLDGLDFTVEMETGTGKTYVYLRTILELYREYGLKKFMIVVPSIAIRKGVEKSIEQLQDHFTRLFGIDLLKYSFVYDGNPQKMSYNLVESDDLSICVINIQAFNKDTNKIRSEDERGRILWEEIKYIRPVVIVDEPQRIEGAKGKKSKSLEAIEGINPLFVLRYSATHKKLYNQIYKLNSYDAYKKNLVKKIQVKTVNGVTPKDSPYVRYLSFTKDLKAKIEILSQDQGGKIRFKTFNVGSNASLEELSGGLPQYREMRVAEEPNKNKPLKISTSEGNLELEKGKSNNGLEDSDAVRIQIRLAIKNHFEKQFSILEGDRKIKGLTLFFIDSVKKVRDNDRPDGRGEYLRIFDEEYGDYIDKHREKIERFKAYFPDYDDVEKVREGYFAVDKKQNVVDVEGWDSSKDDTEMSIKAKSQEDIDRGISLILEKKDELISFDEPLAFIFSHSALREGWDNPNVFTLCTLKNGSSEIAKKQEIGRGLRLPVDITGNRCLDEDINELTVIANDSYENFSRMLQEDFNSSMNFDKNEVTAEVLTLSLEKAGIPIEAITPELVDAFKKELTQGGIIDGKNLLKKNVQQTTKLFNEIEFTDQTLQEHSQALKEGFCELMIQKGTRRIEITNGDNEPYTNTVRSFISEKEFSEIYHGLCRNLTKRAIYKCDIDKDEFISSCIADINGYLAHFSVSKTVNISTGEAGFNDAKVFEMKRSGDKTCEIDVGMKVEPKSDFEVANYVMYHTMLPRLAIFRILKGIEKREALNFQDVLDQVTQRIFERLRDMKAASVYSYEVIEGYDLEEGRIFALDSINEEDFNEEWRVFRSNPNRKSALNEYYKMDSKGERLFADSLEANENVVLFTKLKKGGFIIDTPYGNYSPDWAVVCKKEGLREGSLGIYFIVETKGGKQESNLTEVEKNKIRCGELHFKAVSDLVKFNWVSSYEDFKAKFGVKDSIS